MVSRSRLHERLRQPASLLTLIVAPPGFGKTTLATQWAQSLPDVGAAWLSVDEDDNEIERFLVYVVAALAHVYSEIAPDAEQLLAANNVPTPRAVITALLNDIAAYQAPVALVLDDYHQITAPTIHEALAWMLEHMPANFHLLIATRSEPPLPLSRLRARGQITEIRASDLRFTLEESVAFFDAMGLTLNQSDVASLDSRTEGWVAGLQMAALSLSGRDEAYRRQFVTAFTGSHRHILDYLADEVLERQPEPVLSFLLQTSILNLLTAPLCDAVTGHDDGEAMLAYAEQANLFVVALDEERRWYRYHHLFADVLRHRLTRQFPERVPLLHLRASQWYEANNRFGEAIAHAVAAGEADRAGDLLDVVAREPWTRHSLANLRNWLRLLPDSTIRSRPRLALVDAQVQVFHGHLMAAVERVQQAEQMLSAAADPDPLLQSELRLLQSLTDNLTQQHPDGLELAERAAHELVQAHPLRGSALLSVGIAYWLRGDVDRAEEAFLRTQEACLAVGNTFQAQVALVYLAQIAVMRGRLRRAETMYREAMDTATERGDLHEATGLFVGLGAILYEQDQLEAARRELDRGIELAEQAHNSIVLNGGLIVQAFHAHACRDFERTQMLLQASRRTAETSGMRWAWVIPSFAARWSHLLVLQGDIASARQALEWAEQHPETLPMLQHEANQLATARLLIAERQPEAALTILNPLVEVATRHNRLLHAMQAQALRALALRNQELAFAALETALEQAEPAGYVRLFMDEGDAMRRLLERYLTSRASGRLHAYAARLLRAFAGVAELDAQAALGLVDPLSERELEVLGLMAEGLSNSDIASRLYLSVATVKKHGTNIFGKLGATSRQQAIERARGLRLIR
jgi:LuxR family maltose regulon positive regulatory protein